MIDQYGFHTNLIGRHKIIDGCYIEHQKQGNVYRITKRVRSQHDTRMWIPDVTCQEILTSDQYHHLWLPNVVCDEYFRTKPELELITTRIARLEREIDESTQMSIFKIGSAGRFADWTWQDETTFTLHFCGGSGDGEDDFFYCFECHTEDGLEFFFEKLFEDDHMDATPDFTPAQIFLFKQLMTTLMAYDEGLTCAAAKERGWLL